MQKIPVHIISGFLGSGKTTFLKRLIEKYAPGKKVGIIQNEFAPTGIDSRELKAMDQPFSLLEVNNGSVFCVCLLGDFIQSLAAFIEKFKPEILIMEVSGLSDTTSLAEMLTASLLAGEIYLETNWCIVDALHYGKTGAFQQRIIHQIRMADVLLINKTDVAGNCVPEVKEAVRKINPFASMVETTYCRIDPFPEASQVSKYYFDRVKPLPRPEINSMVIKSGKKIAIVRLNQFLEAWVPKAVRIKGFVNLDTGGTVAVHCTFDTIEIKPVDFIQGPTELIALSLHFKLKEWNQSFREYCTGG